MYPLRPIIHATKQGTCFTLIMSAIHRTSSLTFGAGIIFLILAQPVYKMWIKQEPKMLELWIKLHIEEKKTESTYHV